MEKEKKNIFMYRSTVMLFNNYIADIMDIIKLCVICCTISRNKLSAANIKMLFIPQWS